MTSGTWKGPRPSRQNSPQRIRLHLAPVGMSRVRGTGPTLSEPTPSGNSYTACGISCHCEERQRRGNPLTLEIASLRSQ